LKPLKTPPFSWFIHGVLMMNVFTRLAGMGLFSDFEYDSQQKIQEFLQQR
jgi:hypothetical protein